MLSAGEIERSEKIFNALGDRLALCYSPAEFSIRAFSQARGWVRKGPPVYVKHIGQFLMAEIQPAAAPAYRFMIHREDALDIETHESVLAHIESLDFSAFESTDGKSVYYQFIPSRGGCPEETKRWLAGEIYGELMKDRETIATSI